MGASHARGPLLWLSAAGAVALAVFAWWVLRAGPAGGPGAAGSATGRGAVLASERAPALRPAAGNSLDDVARIDVTASAALAEQELETVLLRGTLVGLDELGRAGPAADGRFELSLWGRPTPAGAAAPPGADPIGLRERLRDRQLTRVTVRQGRWQVRLPAHTARRLAHGELDGLPLFDLQVQELPGDDPGQIELDVTGRWLYPARIRVVDADTQRELEQVRVVPILRDDDREHPGDSPPAISAAPSPLELPAAPVDRRVYLIGAEGYAWRRVEWDHLSSAARVVELRRAGSLEVEIDVDQPLEDWRVTLTTLPDERPYGSLAASAARLRIPGLAPGEYRLALVPREARLPYPAASLASASVGVDADAVAALTLSGRLGARPASVPLECALRLSPTWGAGGPHVAVRALGRTALWHLDSGGMLPGLEIEPRGEVWSVRSARALVGGRYLVTEGRTGFLRELDVGPQGCLGCSLEIPDPVEVTLALVDQATGQPLEDCDLAWLPPTPASVRPRSSTGPWVTRSAGAGVFRARVPAWESLEFEARAQGYGSARITLRPAGGELAEQRIGLARL